MKTIALRLEPNIDIYAALQEWAKVFPCPAGAVLTCVGSLKVACLRLAGAKTSTQREGPFEILSLSGTLSQDGLHLHIAISDAAGSTLGGHLQPGSLIHTTAEIVIGLLEETHFHRRLDPKTGYKELVVGFLCDNLGIQEDIAGTTKSLPAE